VNDSRCRFTLRNYAIDLRLKLTLGLVGLSAARWLSNQNAPLLFFKRKQKQILSKNVSVLKAKLIVSVPKLKMSSAYLFGRRKKYDVRFTLRFVFVLFNIRHFRFVFCVSVSIVLMMMMMMPYHHAKPKPPPFSLCAREERRNF